MNERTRILFSAIIGVVVAAALISGLDALSQPARPSVVEKAMVSMPPPAPPEGFTGADTRDRIEVARMPSLWPFLPPFLIAVIAAFAAYAYTRVRLG